MNNQRNWLLDPTIEALVPHLLYLRRIEKLEGWKEQAFLLLFNKKESVRINAANALGKIGPKAVPALVEALKDKDEKFRYLLLKVLQSMGSKAALAIPAILEAFLKEEEETNPDRLVRWQLRKYVEALDKIGEVTDKAVPALIAIVEANDKSTRTMAARILARIGMPAEKALPALTRYASRTGDTTPLRDLKAEL